MLGLFQAHAVNVYEVLKCVGSVSFTSKSPQSNGPACLENELPPPSVDDNYVASHHFIPHSFQNSFIFSLSLLDFTRNPELRLHKHPRLRFTQMARSSLPLSFFELIFCQRCASRTIKIYVYGTLEHLASTFFLASFIFRRLQFKKPFAWPLPILKHYFNPLVHLCSMSQWHTRFTSVAVFPNNLRNKKQAQHHKQHQQRLDWKKNGKRPFSSLSIDWNIIHGTHRMNPYGFPSTATCRHFVFLVKCLCNYWMNYHDIYTHACPPLDELWIRCFKSKVSLWRTFPLQVSLSVYCYVFFTSFRLADAHW